MFTPREIKVMVRFIGSPDAFELPGELLRKEVGDVTKHGSHWKLGWPWLSRTYHWLFWQVPWHHQRSECMLFFSVLCIWPHISVQEQWQSALQDCLGGFGDVFWRKIFRKSGDRVPRWTKTIFTEGCADRMDLALDFHAGDGSQCLVCGLRFLIFTFRLYDNNLLLWVI